MHGEWHIKTRSYTNVLVLPISIAYFILQFTKTFFMRISTFFLALVFLLNACKSKDSGEAEKSETTKLPPVASAADIKKWITNRNLVTIRAGLIGTGQGSAYEWVETSDTSAFAKEFLEKEMSFEIHLNYDSTGILFYGKIPELDSTGKVIYVPDLTGITYKVEEGLLDVVVLKRYPDGTIEPLGTPYKILGADEKSILLQAPRGYKDKDVVILLAIKQDPRRMSRG